MKEINVLFLDDEDTVLNAVKRTFANELYGVAVAKNPMEAMAIIAANKVKVVLSDQRMPDLSGVEFLNMVKEKDPKIVRILFTAYSDVEAIEAAINTVQVFRFINKPWNPDELKSAVVVAMYHYDLVIENQKLFDEMAKKNLDLELANCKLKVLYDIQKDFSSTVSHELRTPLASIKAAIDIVISGTAGQPTEKQINFLGKAKDNIDRLNRLINNILDLAHLESGKTTLNLQDGDLNKTVASVMENQEAVASQKGLVLKVQLDRQVPAVMFDQDKIIQVLNNLLTNAIKFTPTGNITVSTTFVPAQHLVKVSVKDSGPGISKADVAKLFERFAQLGEAHHQYEGTGLGLAICKEIVRQHRGVINVDSTVGKGSDFYFTLPIKPAR